MQRFRLFSEFKLSLHIDHKFGDFSQRLAHDSGVMLADHDLEKLAQ